jgi:SAM-dependent methyltransferase
VGKPQRFVAASATELPFARGSFEVVLTMYVIEHVVFPAQFLDEAWRVLRPGGRLLIVSPDFLEGGMASERVGFSYGSGTQKLKSGKLVDAVVTAYDSRVRIPRLRHNRRVQVERGTAVFPILTEPRCLCLDGFVPDCDAVYPACPEEIVTYLRSKPDFAGEDVFYRDRYSFGVRVDKAVPVSTRGAGGDV